MYSGLYDLKYMHQTALNILNQRLRITRLIKDDVCYLNMTLN